MPISEWLCLSYQSYWVPCRQPLSSSTFTAKQCLVPACTSTGSLSLLFPLSHPLCCIHFHFRRQAVLSITLGFHWSTAPLSLFNFTLNFTLICMFTLCFSIFPLVVSTFTAKHLGPSPSPIHCSTFTFVYTFPPYFRQILFDVFTVTAKKCFVPWTSSSQLSHFHGQA